MGRTRSTYGIIQNEYRVLLGKPEVKRFLGRLKFRYEDNIKTHLREAVYDSRDWIALAEDRDQWRAYAFFHSVFYYGLHIWGNGANINNILILQKKALRIITNSPLEANCRPIFCSTNILTVINEYIYDCLVHIKIDLNNHNSHFQHHNYPTRHNYFIVTPNVRLTKTKQLFNSIALDMFNRLPKAAHSVDLTRFKVVLTLCCLMILRSTKNFKIYLIIIRNS